MSDTNMKYSWCIVGDTKRPCFNCGEETYNISLSFESPMCSEECDNMKYREYEEIIKSYPDEEL